MTLTVLAFNSQLSALILFVASHSLTFIHRKQRTERKTRKLVEGRHYWPGVASGTHEMLSLDMTTFGGRFGLLGGKELSKQVLIFYEARVSTHLMPPRTSQQLVILLSKTTEMYVA